MGIHLSGQFLSKLHFHFYFNQLKTSSEINFHYQKVVLENLISGRLELAVASAIASLNSAFVKNYKAALTEQQLLLASGLQAKIDANSS